MPKKDTNKKIKDTNKKIKKKNVNIVKKKPTCDNTISIDLTLFNRVLHSTEKVASVLESENY